MDAVGQDIEAEVSIPFKTAVLGGDLEISIDVPQHRQLTITVPPGLDDGDKLRVAGKGMLRVIGLFNPIIKELVEMNYLMSTPVLMDDRALHHANYPLTSSS